MDATAALDRADRQKASVSMDPLPAAIAAWEKRDAAEIGRMIERQAARSKGTRGESAVIRARASLTDAARGAALTRRHLRDRDIGPLTLGEDGHLTEIYRPASYMQDPGTITPGANYAMEMPQGEGLISMENQIYGGDPDLDVLPRGDVGHVWSLALGNIRSKQLYAWLRMPRFSVPGSPSGESLVRARAEILATGYSGIDWQGGQGTTMLSAGISLFYGGDHRSNRFKHLARNSMDNFNGNGSPFAPIDVAESLDTGTARVAAGTELTVCIWVRAATWCSVDDGSRALLELVREQGDGVRVPWVRLDSEPAI